MKILSDPRLFNCLITAFFFLAAFRWAIQRNWPQSAYYFFGGCLNIAVTVMK